MDKDELPPAFREYFAAIGRKGGLRGGKASAAALTPEERRLRARNAGLRSVEARRLKKASLAKATEPPAESDL